MPLFDSITLTMGTAGTGGFSVRSNGFADYTILQQAIIGVFMMLFGINFSSYFLIVRRKYREAFHMEEVITYISIIAIVTLLIVCSAYTLFPSVFEAIHHVFFTVSSIITTTGYATVDFNKWTPFARTLVVLMMFIGACAGSTGGIKVSRLNVLAKGIKKDVQTLLHPNLVCKVRMDGKPVPHETVRSINVFLSIYLITFVICLVLVTLDGKDLVTSFTSVAATLNNIGPGFGEVGPMGNYAGFSDFSKYVLSIAMLAGHLELLPILLLLVPSMWKGTIRLTSRLSAGTRNVFGRMSLFRSGKERSAVMKSPKQKHPGQTRAGGIKFSSPDSKLPDSAKSIQLAILIFSCHYRRTAARSSGKTGRLCAFCGVVFCCSLGLEEGSSRFSGLQSDPQRMAFDNELNKRAVCLSDS